MDIVSAENFVKSAAAMSRITVSEVAEKFGSSQQNFLKRLHVGKFSLTEWGQIAAAMGASFDISFVFPNGGEVHVKAVQAAKEEDNKTERNETI